MAAPTITSITPNHGPAGTQSVMVGTGLNQVTAMRIGGVDTPFLIISSTQINFTLPGGITVGAQDVDLDYASSVTDSGAFTDTAAATRDVTKQPFVSTDIFNAPRAVDSDCDLFNANLTPATGECMRGSPIAIFMHATDPAMNIQKAVGGTSGGGGSVSCDGTGVVLASVRIPANAIFPINTDNNGFGAIHADGHTFAQGAGFARCSGFAYATAAKCLDGKDLLTTSLVGDTGASHMCIIGGVIRPGEFTNGKIPHGLQIILQSKDMYKNANRNLTFRWPSTTSDGYYFTGYGGSNPKLTMGVALCLKQSFSIAGLRTPGGKIIAEALVDYVSFVTNTIGGSNTVCVGVSGAGTGTWDSTKLEGDVRQEFFELYGYDFDQPHSSTIPWALDCKDIFAALQILDSVDNNSPSHSYQRMIAGYTGSGVGTVGLGNKTGGAPIVPFSADL